MKLKRIIDDEPWPYIYGGILLAVLNIILFATTGKPWKITTGFLYWGAGIIETIGMNPRDWYYFKVYGNNAPESFFMNKYTIINLATIMGAYIAALSTSEFKWKKVKNSKQLVFGLLGGVLMGFGSRLSFGCNIGSYFSAIPSFSLHGWLYGIFMFFGAYIGSKLLLKYLI